MSFDNRIFGNERKYVEEVLSTSFASSSGAKMMTRLEQAFSERFEQKFAISFVNGTATMHAALEALGIGEGDEVIVPPLTMSATTFAVLQCNATPVFADVDPHTFQIDAVSIEQRITTATRAIITVSLYGMCPEMDAIKAIAEKNSLAIIEDNAECFLGKYKGRLAGSFGDFASYSFQSSKHITSGEGGMITTNNVEYAEKIRKVQSLGYTGVGAKKAKISKSDIQSPSYARHSTLGWNYRMPELCCAVALAQIENIDELVQRRIDVAKTFSNAAEQFRAWFVPQEVPDYCEHSYWTWVIKLNAENISWDEFYKEFRSRGGDGVYGAWRLTYLEPMFESMDLLGRERYITSRNKALYKKGLCPNAEAIQPNLIQFKTNYWKFDDARTQAGILFDTLSALDKRY